MLQQNIDNPNPRQQTLLDLQNFLQKKNQKGRDNFNHRCQ